VPTLTICIGNSDDGLSQSDWAGFWFLTGQAVRKHASHIFGEFLSLPTSPFQNAAWVVSADWTEAFRDDLAVLAARFGQDSIAVAVGETEMVAGQGKAPDTEG
jgi:hypothetical protein